MELAAKLQIKPTTTVSVQAVPADGPDLSGIGRPARDPAEADAVIAFVRQRAEGLLAVMPIGPLTQRLAAH